MALERDIYRALEDVVGPENMSEDPSVLVSYRRHWGSEIALGPDYRWMPSFEAVLLPGNTDEVQKIVKLCNRKKIQFKAHSTGWGPWMAPIGEGCIGLDLRRMNSILEINEKGMYAVVEPYVLSAQLQAELMKRGLATTIIAAGSNASALPIVSLSGTAWNENAYSNYHQNCLGLEWVMPTGDVVRVGSLGSGAGFFAGEGPGPSLRGLASGSSATQGAMGVFTKVATKVYHWPGPSVLPVEGASPYYHLKPQENMGIWAFTSPTWQTHKDAGYKIGQSEIALSLTRLGAWHLGADNATSLDEGLDFAKEVISQIQGKGKVGCWIVIIAANTRREFQYRERVLKQIIKDTDGELLPFIEDDPNKKLGMLSRWIRASTCERGFRRFGGDRTSCILGYDCIDNTMNQATVQIPVKEKYIAEGKIWDDGADSACGMYRQNGRFGHVEQVAMASCTHEGLANLLNFSIETQKKMLDPKNKCVNDPHYLPPNREYRGWLGGLMRNEHVWTSKLKKAFDPDWLSESSWYILPEESEVPPKSQK